MNREDYLINKLSSHYIGDDGAIVGEYIYSMDAFFENIHFKTSWMSLKQIAIKAMLVNISDAIVMNAKPKYALLTVAIPVDFTKKNLKQLANGFKKIAKQYNIVIIGGDTISSDKLNISVTLISKTIKPILRSGAKNNDLVCFTGNLGSCKADLKKLFDGKKINIKSKLIKPSLKADFFYDIASDINSALDISDGLFFELERLSKINKIGFKFFSPIPAKIGCSGEEYEILFTFNKEKLEKIKQIAKRHKIKLNIFAKIVNGKYKCKCKKHHF